MLKVASDLSSFTLGAGEPWLFEVQLQDAAGVVQDIADRAFVLSFYGPMRDAIASIDGEASRDRTGAVLQFARDGEFSELLAITSFACGGLQFELAERLRMGRDIFATGSVKIGISAPFVPSLDNAPIGRSATRVVIRDGNPSSKPSIKVLMVDFIEPGTEPVIEVGTLDFRIPGNAL